jgi:hypothetical protein
MTRETDRTTARMLSGDPFRYLDLRHADPSVDWRVTDRLIQQWRRNGWIAKERRGRDIWWTLTDLGRSEARP